MGGLHARDVPGGQDCGDEPEHDGDACRMRSEGLVRSVHGGGQELAEALHVAAQAGVGFRLDEASIPLDEQVRGGCVQGLGGALYEHCVYDEQANLVNATLADYVVPMAAEMPDIGVAHVQTPTAESELGAKGAGESGTGAAPGVRLSNEALNQVPRIPMVATGVRTR